MTSLLAKHARIELPFTCSTAVQGGVCCGQHVADGRVTRSHVVGALEIGHTLLNVTPAQHVRLAPAEQCFAVVGLVLQYCSNAMS